MELMGIASAMELLAIEECTVGCERLEAGELCNLGCELLLITSPVDMGGNI